MKKVMVVFGTRPEAIKMAPVVFALKNNQDFKVEVCVTGQHKTMLDQVLSFFEIEPDFDLAVMKDNQGLSELSARLITKLDEVISSVMPDIVLVHGDTSSAFIASLVAFYHKIKVGHVEAGLRTYDLDKPWPEEANRQLISKLGLYHFAPTEKAKNNLLKEGIKEEFAFLTGNTIVDAVLWTKNKLEEDKELQTSIIDNLLKLNVDCETKYILVTGHRRENLGDGIKQICDALSQIATKYPELHIIYPVHLNPKVKEVVHELLDNSDRIHLIEPQSYEYFVFLMMKSWMILTDSGGIQEEAITLNKPLLIMRDTTERPEALIENKAMLVGTNVNNILEKVDYFMSNQNNNVPVKINPFGDGKSGEYIAKTISKIL
ncbi:MAG: UDP-N-acetylglucosamine 2-epimerase (non-hydrolyzing) [Bacteroidales bacterium]|nr:UDP-N-acetylglucosamine 2-epimerase (non-hydrolyzing) [Bacteroidales bacterium]